MMIQANHTIRLNDIKDEELIQDALSSYPIFDNEYRETLNTNIINHYLYEEIGLETPALFAHYLKCRMNEIMPKYNKLYESEMLKLDPLSNYNMKENYHNESSSSTDSETNSESESNSTSNSTSNASSETGINTIGKTVHQNTPQGQIQEQTINNYSYATTQDLDSTSVTNTGENESSDTDVTNRDSSSNATNESNSESESAYEKIIRGNKGVNYMTLYKDFKNNFISIDKLIINDLQDLFMGIY